MKIHQPLASTSLLLLLAACNRPQPCPNCEGEDIAAEEEGVLPDLPCEGADLQTDDLNCGICGNACDVMWPGTKYAAGGCTNGECGPTWGPLLTLPPPPVAFTCAEKCAVGNIACVPRGCSGMTAFVCQTIGDFGSQCNLGNPLNEALIDVSGECDEVIPYPNNVEPGTFIDFACCCERP